MEYIYTDEKLALVIDGCEVGYISLTKQTDGIVIEQTYIYPGCRENGYALSLIRYMVDNYNNQIVKVNCPYYRIMANEYKLLLV